MKAKHTLLLTSFALLLSTLFSSCTKTNAPAATTSQEAVYKQQVEQLLHGTFVSSTELQAPQSGVVHFQFKSYEEMYHYFEFLKSNKVYVHIDTIQPDRVAAQETFTNITLATGPTVVNYSGTGTGSCTADNNQINGKVAVSYALHYQITYPAGGATQGFISQNTPGPGTLAYSGIGTASGTPSFNPESSGHGLISGLMQGVGTVAGTSLSFFIQVSGNYSVTIPPQPYGESSVVTSLTASVS